MLIPEELLGLSRLLQLPQALAGPQKAGEMPQRFIVPITEKTNEAAC